MALGRILEAVVACRDLDRSVGFHAAAFDFDVLERTSDAALLGVSGVETGRLRLVAAHNAARHLPDPQIWDIGPRLLGMYSRDLSSTAEKVTQAGGQVRPIVSYPYRGGTLTECVALGTDGLWWTLPQVRPGHLPSPARERNPDRLHGELHSAVIVVGDHHAAVDFFARAGGMTVLFDGVLAGQPIEVMIGMPVGATLRLSFLTAADRAPARLELMSSTGTTPADESGRGLGLRRLVFLVDDRDATRAALLAAGGVPLGENLLRGPGGVEIELRADPGER